MDSLRHIILAMAILCVLANGGLLAVSVMVHFHLKEVRRVLSAEVCALAEKSPDPTGVARATNLLCQERGDDRH